MQQPPLELHVISAREVRELLPFGECVAAVKQAMQGVSAGKVLMPLRQFMPLPSGDGKLAWMPGYLGEPGCFGIKLLSLFPGNPRVGLSSHVGLMRCTRHRLSWIRPSPRWTTWPRSAVTTSSSCAAKRRSARGVSSSA